MQPPLTILSTLLILLLTHLTATTATDFPLCDPADKAVLLQIRDHFGGSLLDDWTNTSNCCSDWDYVGCGMYPRHHNYGRVNAVTFSRFGGLSGTIPPQFGDLPYLDYFILDDNINVTGSIPKSFKKLKFLTNLELDSNNLSGPIPQEIFGLKRLKKVNLSGNRFSGEIPSLLSPLTKLTEFNVSNNQLCGRIPSGLKRFGAKSFEHNKCLCGSPLSVPCKS